MQRASLFKLWQGIFLIGNLRTGEWVNIANIAFIAVYMPLSNPYFNKIILKLRMRFGSIMIPATNFKSQFHKYATQGNYAMALAADQNPGNPLSAYWVPFFGQTNAFCKRSRKGCSIK